MASERSTHFSRLPPHLLNAETRKRAHDQTCLKWDNNINNPYISNRKDRVNVESYPSVQGTSAASCSILRRLSDRRHATSSTALGLRQQQQPNHEGHDCDDDRVPRAGMSRSDDHS